MKTDVKKLDVSRTKRAQRVIERLAAGPAARPIRIETPEGPAEIAFKDLTAEQESEAQVRAYERVIEKGVHKIRDAIGDAAFEENVEHFKFLECLALAVVDPKTGEQIYTDGAHLASRLSERRVIELLEMQNAIESDAATELAEALEQLKKKGDSTSLNAIAPSLPKSLLLTTVNQLANLLAAK